MFIGQSQDLALFGGAEDTPDALDFEELLLAELGVAAGDHDAGLRCGFVCAANQVAALLLGRLRHCAGIDQIDIGLTGPRHDFPPGGLEASLVGGSFCVVQFAA